MLVFLQPDIGTALVYAAALAAALFFAGARWLHLAVLAAIGTFVVLFVLWLGPAAGLQILKPYQTARLTAFANPENDPGGAGYNVDQSITAVGAGGIRGRGVEDATQTNLDYLPEHATDFVFASLAEQRGFVGASILLLLYLLVIWRAIKIVAVARDAFSAIVAGVDRVRAPVPDLRQRRHDDRARSGDRDPLAVRELRGLGDGDEPGRDRRSPGDLGSAQVAGGTTTRFPQTPSPPPLRG